MLATQQRARRGGASGIKRKRAASTPKGNTGNPVTSSPAQQSNSASQPLPASTSTSSSASSTPPASQPPAAAANNDDEGSDAELLGGGKRPRLADDGDSTVPMHPLVQLGRRMAREGDTFSNIKQVLTLGFYHRNKAAQAQSVDTAAEAADDDAAEPDPIQSRYLRAFELMCTFEPNLEEHIREVGATAAIMMITAGRRNARSEDVAKAKRGVVQAAFHVWTPAVTDPDDKSLRGWNHPEMGRLLCPTIYNWDDQQVRHDLQHKVIKPNPTLFPPALYKRHVINPKNKFQGLMKGEYVLKIAKLVYHGPKSLTGKESNSRSIAQQYDIIESSPPMLAYCGTLLVYGLSSDEKFDPEGKIGFKYRQFYFALLDALNALTPRQRSIVLSYWNKQLFPTEVNPAADLPAGVKSTAQELAEAGDQEGDSDGDEFDPVQDDDDDDDDEEVVSS